jgi:hypothetical protein
LTLKIPDSDWKYKDWIDYIIENNVEVFGSKNDNMLKVYYVHSNDRAKKILENKSTKQGQFHIVSMNYRESKTGKSKETEYWMHELEPGLLTFFTSSTREGYEKTLKQKIRNSLGLHEMWIKPDTFRKIRNDLIHNKDCGIIKFLADRKRRDPIPQNVTENAERHIQYRTDNPNDGISRMYELEHNLGMTPRSIDYVFNGNRLQITHEGLFHVKDVTLESFALMSYVMEMIRGEAKSMRDIAQGLTFNNLSSEHLEDWKLESGKIILSDDLDSSASKQIVRQFGGFLFVEPKINAEPVFFYSDVIDSYKGSIFALNGSRRELILIPKFKVTFETFIEFYREVVEVIDEKATWARLSDTLEYK